MSILAAIRHLKFKRPNETPFGFNWPKAKRDIASRQVAPMPDEVIDSLREYSFVLLEPKRWIAAQG